MVSNSLNFFSNSHAIDFKGMASLLTLIYIINGYCCR
ncbi:predicted coding region HP0704 [Helicobacter pylori 26695]|uniref:Uncharacterized protein n=1 Tax=Helicobacter pylori (strain ATCC 700392 / 26695) TaxID=85962 RepID=O25409_HELPY|nr:predicted coding region HP0704 [Helicobacter pylori 26695]